MEGYAASMKDMAAKYDLQELTPMAYGVSEEGGEGGNGVVFVLSRYRMKHRAKNGK